ncbi:gamma-glutamylcyclotransferase [Paenochrobactrum sp. BZR 588]|uniref:gamma-glutamylcyclotransferase n=1 Tax=unclassified Paenochrobactrum TaxID=2639760 RepID=UPI0038547EBB
MKDFWVFGYGSLMWRPGFDFVESKRARLHGFHRSLCIYSHVYRGTAEKPGLVLGLDEGGFCDGMAFKIAEDASQQVVDYLREREQVNNVYLEKLQAIELVNGEKAEAIVYVADCNHVQYAHPMAVELAVDIVASASGNAGPNHEYVKTTLQHLEQIGVADEGLEMIWQHVQARLTQ